MVHHGHALAPERLRVLDVTPFDIPQGPTNSSWSCTRCGIDHRADDSWSVVFDTARGPRSMVLCRACAEIYSSADVP